MVSESRILFFSPLLLKKPWDSTSYWNLKLESGVVWCGRGVRNGALWRGSDEGKEKLKKVGTYIFQTGVRTERRSW